ncbi:unnamed protein product, partial [Amoebophrya sp. A25]
CVNEARLNAVDGGSSREPRAVAVVAPTSFCTAMDSCGSKDAETGNASPEQPTKEKPTGPALSTTRD